MEACKSVHKRPDRRDTICRTHSKGHESMILWTAVAPLFYLSFSKYELWFFLPLSLYILSRLRFFWAWLLSGFFSFFFSLLWIRIALIDYGGVFPPIAFFLIALLSLTLTFIQFGLVYLLWKLFGFRLILLPFLWVLGELFRSTAPYGGFPWLLVGELLPLVPVLKYYLSAGGVYLGSLVVWLFSLIPYAFRNIRFALSLLVLLSLPLPFVRKDPPPPPELRVAIIQPNVEESIKLNEDLFYKYLPNYWELIEEALKHEPHVVLLPESAFPFTVSELPTKGERLLGYSKKATLVTGIIDIRFEDGWKPYNSVFVIEDGAPTDFYDKVRLLPFGEYVPFPFGFVKSLFGAIGGIDYVPGKEARCVKAGKVKLGTPICFEVSYSWLFGEFARCGDIIAVFTNDGWFRDSDGTWQHFRQARVRALENRKFVLWINNTGPSAVISPDGEILKKIPYGTKGYIIYEFKKSRFH
ncbi:MAG TPA: apolipoprotein N-acyltransferase [Aquifex aeolicus]|nr:apolipoprotein N-acyltransferase [Aquifex aeolicus]